MQNSEELPCLKAGEYRVTLPSHFVQARNDLNSQNEQNKLVRRTIYTYVYIYAKSNKKLNIFRKKLKYIFHVPIESFF